MNRTGFWPVVYLSRLSQPVHERAIYRAIVTRRVSRIVEIGIGDGVRASRMISAALRHQRPNEIRYSGIDLFEARSQSQPGLTLKLAHRRLGETGVQLRLLPGDPYSALARAANALTGTDLIVIGADQDAASLERAWFYLPRMLHKQSLILQESLAGPKPIFNAVAADELSVLAKAA